MHYWHFVPMKAKDDDDDDKDKEATETGAAAPLPSATDGWKGNGISETERERL